MAGNLLSRETSPYLLQHKDNPVAWQPWSSQAFAEARDKDKPVLLSVGYAACHWCHVMAHESFESPKTAALMNELFVNIKVDREERPDVDTIYQSALALMGQQGGWPLTMFLTPDGHPFWGGTYFPPEPRWGRPGFPNLLQAVAMAYRNEPEKIEKNVGALRDALDQLARVPAGNGLTDAILDDCATHHLRMVDFRLGGTTGAPKFPQPVLFRWLWRAYRRTGTPRLGEAVTTTLTQLGQGGIYDHVGGGFARYSTDEQWLVPHFEKMLYDNALLVDLMTEVWLETRETLLARRIDETLRWVLSDLMVAHEGAVAYAGAFDADSEGEEGKFYVWRADEIDEILGADAAAFKAVFDVTAEGNWEGHTILNRSGAKELCSDTEEARFSVALARLREVRAHRVPPLRDDKVLADWNGLLIAALARAAAAFSRPDWLAAAEGALAFNTRHMMRDGRLLHTWCAGSARHPAVIDDYAAVALGAIALFETTGRTPFLDMATGLVAVADRHYWDQSSAGYFLSADDTDDVISRTKPIVDHATPSGNGTMAEVLVRLYFLTGDEAYRRRAEDIIAQFSGNNPQYLAGVPSLLCAFDLLSHGRQIYIVGDLADDRSLALRHAALTSAETRRVVLAVSGEDALRLAPGKSAINGAPAAYVCRGQTCTLPIVAADALTTELSRRAAS